MTSYNVALEGNVLRIGFGEPAQNDVICRDVESRLAEMKATGELAGGELIRVNGPASLPAAMVIAHHLAHLYGAVACFDPKLAKYVVAVVHGGKYAVGDIIPAADVIDAE